MPIPQPTSSTDITSCRCRATRDPPGDNIRIADCRGQAPIGAGPSDRRRRFRAEGPAVANRLASMCFGGASQLLAGSKLLVARRNRRRRTPHPRSPHQANDREATLVARHSYRKAHESSQRDTLHDSAVLWPFQHDGVFIGQRHRVRMQ